MALIDGPRRPAKHGGAPDALVVLLHGFGSNGDDLIQLAPMLADAAPSAAFVSPNAPESVPGFPEGRQWFALTSLDPGLLAAGARKAAPNLDGFLDRELDRQGVSPARLVLIGFSQGSMMSLQVGLNRAAAPAAIIAFSGGIADADIARKPAVRPPVLLVHGDQDDRVPPEASLAAASLLAEGGHGAEIMICAGLGHSIAPEGIARASHFLKAALAGRYR